MNIPGFSTTQQPMVIDPKDPVAGNSTIGSKGKASAGPTSDSVDGGGAATQLIIKINDELSKLGELISRSNLPEEDQANFAAVMEGFNSFVDSMGQSPNQPKPDNSPKGGMGVTTPEAGSAKVIPAM